MKPGGNTVIKNRKGQAMVEAAIVITLFLALFFGIIEFGRAWFYSNNLDNSVRAAARYGAVLGNSSTSQTLIETYLRSEIGAVIPPDGIQGTPSVQVFDKNTNAQKLVSDATHGDTLRVSVVYDFEVIPGIVTSCNQKSYFSGTVPMTRSASILVE